ncbi:MAG: hypothetical protein J7J52_05840 [Deltaproteobacteria bacterium]|nr:hypothetical protein [Deltaproteobacteria bacterium]
MQNRKHNHKKTLAVQKSESTQDEILRQKVSLLNGQEIIDFFLEQTDSRKTVQNLPEGDFYWLVKKIGEKDCLPLLELASKNQLQYILDIEIWKKDRIDIGTTFNWLHIILLSNPERLAKWIFDDLKKTAALFFLRTIQLDIREEDEPYNIKEGFFTLDGTFYIKPVDESMNEDIQLLCRAMARVDLKSYHNLILNFTGILPAETEEELYRLRNVRLAEHGFLPYDKAIAIYSPLEQASLKQKEQTLKGSTWIQEKETDEPVPILPIFYAQDFTTLVKAFYEIHKQGYSDKLKMEFAALCNTIISANTEHVDNFDTLIKICRQAAGYLNLALEHICGEEIGLAVEIITNNPLDSVFRVGFGMAMKLKWKAKQWLQKSWFKKQGMDNTFWGDLYGGILSGILRERPMFYSIEDQKEEFRGFESLSETEKCKDILEQIIAIDNLLSFLEMQAEDTLNIPKDATFIPLIFNFWARKFLGMAPSFSGISMEKAKDMFAMLRVGDKHPPFQMKEFEQQFISDMTEYLPATEANIDILKDALLRLWNMFKEAFESVLIEDLDPRYMRDFIWIIKKTKP